MKKLACVLLLSLVLCGCQSNNTYDENSVGNEDNEFTYSSLGRVFEWVSPDGVHYWVVEAYNKYGITPRYNSNGELIIDQVER